MGRSPRSTAATATAAAAAITPLATTSASTLVRTPTQRRTLSPHQTRTSTRTSRTTKVVAQSSHLDQPGPESTPSPPEEHISTPPAIVVRAGIQVEPKSHALRSVGGERERTPSPFPDKWGGKDRCGVADDDEKDEVLMAVCSVIADNNNRAWSPDEIAQAAYAEGWMRPPTAAIEPAVVVNNCIRAHQKRCATATPPRSMLLAKYQLAGSVNESVLESALHPNAFDDGARPKGTVWYLVTVGKTKWKNPFDGLEVARAPPRKPLQTNKPKLKPIKPAPLNLEKKGKTKLSTPTPTPAPQVKIRLLVNPSVQSEEPETAARSMSPSLPEAISRRGSSSPMPVAPSLSSDRFHRTLSNPLDSSDDDSDSDSDMDMDLDAPGPSRLARPKLHKVLPPPINISGSPRVVPPPFIHRPASSSSLIFDLFQPSGTPVLSSFPGYGMPAPHTSPFPSHSLDNTTWTARHEQDRFSHLETSSSSSDEDMRDQDWGTNSGILIRGEEGDGLDVEDDNAAIWGAGDEEAKVKEATDALRVLFPMTSPDDEIDSDPIDPVGIFGIRAAASDTGSLAESSSTATAKHGPLNPTVALSAYTASSPINSPNLRPLIQLAPETSPTQHLPSNLRNTFVDDQDMEGDEEDPAWLDESGELFVKAEDTLSEAESASNVGDIPPLEHERTAEWAKVIAENTLIKSEPDDYPSPLTTEPEERLSRSSSESRTPSSRSSELPPFEMDADLPEVVDLDEVMVGPESVSVEELDVWLPTGKAEKTPQKSRRGRYSRGSNSGSIGVAALCSALPLLVRNRSTRSSRTARRGRPASPTSPRSATADYPSPALSAEDDVERMDDEDAIGTEDLERACREAEAREEQCRKRCRERAEQQRLLFEAYRQKVKESSCSAAQTPADMSDPRSPWSDVGFGSNESLHLQTPTALSPFVLQSIGNMTLSDTAYPTSMNPQDLLSPPIVPQAGPTFDEAFIQSEVDALMATNLPILALPEILPASVASLPPLAPRPPVESKAKVDKKAPIPIPGAATQPSADTSPQRPQFNSTASATSASSGSTSGTTQTPAKPPVPPPRKQINQTTKRLMPGIDACVIDNIPVYAHETPNKIKILRRLDSDFVNATSLLLALGVAPAKHGEYLNAPSPQYHTHRTVPESHDGHYFSPGVPGIWVQHCEALEYVKKLDPRGPQAWDILREDLFHLFATLAGIEPQHSASPNFGAFFIPTPSSGKPVPPSSSNLAASSVNSKSAPNLTMLSTSAPVKGPLRASTFSKGPLVRSAPPTPPDGAPQPKRRRATIVGAEPAPLAKLAPGPKKTGAPIALMPITPISIKPTPVQKRTTRASSGGEMATKPSPKPVKRTD